MTYEQDVMELIASAGDSKDKAFAALSEIKNGNVDKARQFIKESKEADVVAHNIQTRLIQDEMSDDKKKKQPMTLLMAHAQDHYMTSQLARDLIEQLIEVFDSGAPSKSKPIKKGKSQKAEKKEPKRAAKKESKKAEAPAATGQIGNLQIDENSIDYPKAISAAKKIAENSGDDKVRMLLCCAGGLSTNLLMQEMKKVVANSKKLDEKNFDFTAIPVDDLERQVKDWDIVLIGPQVGHKIHDIEKVCEQNNKPYTIIDKDVYGAVDGATVVKMGLVLYRKAKLSI